MSLLRALFSLLGLAGLSWNEANPQNSAANHGHFWGDIAMDMTSLVQLAESLGGGNYPGMGSGQNDTMGFPDSVAPGFPLNLQFVVPANTVKQQLTRLSFQPAPFRTYVTGSHSHTGDSHSVHTHSVLTSLTHGATGNELTVHRHRWYQTSGQVTTSPTTTPPNLGKWLEGKVYDSGGNWVNNGNLVALDNDDANIHTTDLWTDLDGAGSGSQDHGHPGPALHSTGYLDQTSTSNSNTGAAATPSGVSEGTSPDAMHVLVDGTDVTTQLGGPFTTAQTELDITPYVAPGSGLHTVQITTATNLGRVAGIVRNKAIVNNLGTAA